MDVDNDTNKTNGCIVYRSGNRAFLMKDFRLRGNSDGTYQDAFSLIVINTENLEVINNIPHDE